MSLAENLQRNLKRRHAATVETVAIPVSPTAPPTPANDEPSPPPAARSALAEQLSAAANAGRQQARNQQNAATQAVYTSQNVAINQHGSVFLLVNHGSRREALPIDGEAACEHIMLALKESSGQSVGRETINRELGPIKAKARRDGTVKNTAIRCAKTEGGYIVDLGDAAGRAVYIAANGWSVTTGHDVLFIRDNAYGELPMPELFETARGALEFLLDWVERQGLHRGVALQVVATMVEYLRPDTPFPVLAMVGPAGSGKSGAANRITQCIDPTKSGKLADVKPTPEDMAAGAQVSYVLTADNLQRLAAEVQDLFCKAATGAVFTVRKYYAQSEVLRLSLHVPLVLTFVNNGITAPDLLDRTILAHVKRPAAYRSADELAAEFAADRPKITGALYTLLAAGLARLSEVAQQRKWTHRLVDFIQMGEAFTQAAGHPPGYFLDLFVAHRAAVAADVADGDSFTQVLLVVLKEVAKDATTGAKLPAWRQWGESGGKGHAAVVTEAGVTYIAFKPSMLLAKCPRVNQYIPENERQLSDALTRITPLLRAMGIEPERREMPGKRSAWVFACKRGALGG